MAARLREHATYEDLLKVPENMIAELIEGELFASPRPGMPHADAVTELGSLLRTAFGRRGSANWHILFEPELHLGRNVLVPDLAGWRTERVPVLPHTPSISIEPDWVCEVLSHSTARIDRGMKLPIYAQHGVAHAWIVDVDQQYLEVKRLVDGRWSDVAVFTGAAKIRAEPFESIEIDTTLLWGAPPA
jgi:Uma2 family endonuclease